MKIDVRIYASEDIKKALAIIEKLTHDDVTFTIEGDVCLQVEVA